MAVTAEHIARECGLSQPTVSHILGNRADRYSPVTRKRVIEAAERLGYRPNVAARATRSGRFDNIALLLSSTGSSVSTLPPALLCGIDAALAERNRRLTVARLPEARLTDDAFVPRILTEYHADGLLIDYTHQIPPAMIELIERHDLPAIWLNVKRDYDCVHPDDEAAGYQATRHLLEQGHTRIAYLDYSHPLHLGPDLHYSATDRRAGYARAMSEAGRPDQVIARGSGPIPYRERRAFTRDWLAQSDRPTAVVCYGNDVAGVVMLAVAEHGLRIPDDLSLVSIGDDQMVQSVGIPVTLMSVPQSPMGRQAVAVLHAMIEDHRCQGTAPVAVPFTFMRGQSVTAPHPIH